MSTRSRVSVILSTATMLALVYPLWPEPSPSAHSGVSTTLATNSEGANQVMSRVFSEKAITSSNASRRSQRALGQSHGDHTGIYLSYVNPASSPSRPFLRSGAGRTSPSVIRQCPARDYRTAGFPGIEITGPGDDWLHPHHGQFPHLNIASDATGDITRLDLTYVEHCAAGRPSNYGEVLIKMAPHIGSLYARPRASRSLTRHPRVP